MIRLYINGAQADLFESEKIQYQKQVNSLKDLSSRQANLSFSFKLPRTANNIQIFQGLGITGSNSQTPYVKNESRLFVGNVCLVFSGWTIPDATTKDYFEIHTYDGNIDFFKALDNITFDDISLPELSHEKDVPTIKSNWENSNNAYRYLVADYNGRTHFNYNNENYINIDYLIPAVPIKYLWDRIFFTFGYTFEGTIFQDPEFLDTLITYPKGVIAGEVAEEVFHVNFPKQYVIPKRVWPQWLMGDPFDYESQIAEGSLTEIPFNGVDRNLVAWTAPELGTYKFTFSAKIYPRAKKGVGSGLYFGFNKHNQNIGSISTNDLIRIVWSDNGEKSVDTTEVIPPSLLNAGDTIAFFYQKDQRVDSDSSEFELDVTIQRVNTSAIDQIEFFKGLSPKDFFREVLWRFGLTPFPSKDTNHITFLTWKERLNGTVEDWSDRFVSHDGEQYTFDNYAKNNYYRFKYNGEGDDFNDGVIRINNANLSEKTDVIVSKTYSVERNPVTFNVGGINERVPKMELWQKELQEDSNNNPIIEYKPRESRFTFIREKQITRNANLGSQQLGQYDQATKVRIANNFNYSNQQIIENRYQEVRDLFRDMLVIKAKFLMSESEFDTFDLKPRVYIKQLGGKDCRNRYRGG